MNTERPGGWVDGIGWVALLRDLSKEDLVRLPDGRIRRVVIVRTAGVVDDHSLLSVIKWDDGTTPEPPQPRTDPTEVITGLSLDLSIERRRSAILAKALSAACADGWSDGPGAERAYLDAAAESPVGNGPR